MKIFALLLIPYMFYCGSLFFYQRKILFPVHLIPKPPLNLNIGIKYEIIPINIGNLKSEAWYMPVNNNKEKPCPVVIFAHGNAELIDFWPQSLKRFNSMGISVLLVEYPGYGRSKSSPSKKNIDKIFLEAYDIICKRKDVDTSKIILVGRSLGGGAICSLAQKRNSAAIILMSTFANVKLLASKYFVPTVMVRDPFDNLKCVEKYDKPILIMHGKNDEVIPYEHAIILSEASKNGKLITYDCGHNNFPIDENFFWNDVELFIKNIFLR
ncbi:MAG: alpha/beta hydrolase [Desulfobacterales bacterium]|nr:alpha/beta hydrolase [Desulfobacterales bacterium]